MTLNCSFISSEEVECNGTRFKVAEEKLSYKDETFWMYLGIYAALVLAAGLMSGLTMGLLSLDVMTLRILKDGGTSSEKKYARRILPIVQRHHLLLVTLLLGNAAAVEAMPIFLDRISDPITAILVSVTAVLIFGEVIPQAVCTRFGLAIGAYLSPLVYGLMAIFFIIAWPLSKLLDCLLGTQHATFFRRAQLKVLVDIHGETSGDHSGNQEVLTNDEVLIIKGALDMKNKTANDAMVPINCVYMLDVDRRLDHETMNEIISQSHSRIPVYNNNPENIIGLLIVKTLIKLDPDDATPIRQLVSDGTSRPVLHTTADKPLFDLLNEFQKGKSHLAIVHNFVGSNVSLQRQDSTLIDDPNIPLLDTHDDTDDVALDIQNKVTGIITMEDVLEELLQEEIIDETDVFIDIKKQIQVARAFANKKTSRAVHRSISNPP